jgi:type II secretory pathway component GspD/PulD (secretin)
MRLNRQYRRALFTPRASTASALTALVIAGGTFVFAQNSASPSLPSSGPTAAESTPASAPKPAALAPPPPTKRQLQAAEDAYLEGARLLDRNDLTSAEARFTEAVHLNPNNADYARSLQIVREHRVAELVQQAGKARLLGQPSTAEALLAQARTIDPQNAILLEHMNSGPLSRGFQPSLAQQIGPDGNPEPASDLTGSSSVGRNGLSFSGVTVLAPTTKPQSFHLRGDVQQVLSQVASSFGIRVTFDSSVTPTNLRFDLDDTTYAQAMPILFDMGHLFAIPLDAHSILVAKDNLENRQRFEHQYQETIYLPALTPEQLTELSTVIRNVFDLKQVTVQNSAGTMIVRAPESVLSAMNLTLADLVDGGAEVMVDLKLYAVDKTNMRKIGAQLPQQAGIYNVESAAQSLIASNQSLVNQAIAEGLIPAGASNIEIALALISSGLVQSTLLSSTLGFFGGGTTLTGLTATPNASFTLALNSSEVHAVDNIQLRTSDRQLATFRVGSRYPITTSTYSFSSASTSSTALAGLTINGVSATSLLNSVSTATVPQIQYEDLGLTLKATPVVQKSNSVSMLLDLKVQALAGTSLNNIPVLSSRQFTANVTVADGQTALLVSSLSKSESAAVSGYPYLGELPGFQSTVSNKETNQNYSDLLILITPHIVRRRSSVISGPRIALNLPLGSD